jgi:deoxyribose-phosphate aldolase
MVVRPEHAELVARGVAGTRTIATSVVGFPTASFSTLSDFPRISTAQKLADARTAIDGFKRGGAKVGELDMILDVHALKAGNYAAVERDIKGFIAGAEAHGKAQGVKVHVKVIVETSLLTANELKMASGIVRNTRALAIKTSTGFGARGASLTDLRIMNRVIAGSKLV